jgi:primase-polymerase (primpol)-like protein
MICTGNVWIDKPVNYRQDELDFLVEEMIGPNRGSLPPLPSQPERESDEVLIARATNAKNGEKFTSLMNGNWKELGYSSQSRADFALMSMITFYSKNNEQCVRMFRRSELGKRKKADRDDYVNRMIEEFRAQQADEAQRKQKQREAFRHVGADDGRGDAALPPTMDLGEMLKGLIHVVAEKPMIVGRDNHAIRLPPQVMRGLLKHNKTIIPPEAEDEKEKIADTFTLWEISPDRLVAYTITFDPSGPEFCQSEDGRLALNLWKRRPPNPPNDWQVRATLFTDHVAYLVPIETERNRFLDWLAHIEQRPGELPHSHYLMIAVQQGIGRNLLTSILALVWSGHVAMDFDLKQSLASGFNGQLSQKLLAVVDEINEGGTGERWGHSEKLKSMLTASHRHINPKYGLQHTEKNCCRFIILTNYETGLPLTEEDRRFNVIMNPRDPRDKEYYHKLYNLITPKPDMQFIESVREYLRTRPIDGFNPGEKPPMNDAKRAVVASSMTREDEHAAEIVATYPRDLISADDLFTFVFGVEPDSAHDASRKWALMRPIATKAGMSRLPQTIRLGGRRKAKVWALRNLEKWMDANADEIEQELKRTADYLGQAPS